MSGAADNMKKWEAKEGRFLRNFLTHNAIINSIAINQDGVMASSADNGSMRFWDYRTGYCFQHEATKAQPGSLDSEAGIYASTFDKTGLCVAVCAMKRSSL
jgi:pleiotropic regulator 1